MSLMPNVHFSKNQIIFEEGYPADSVYLICDGTVEIFKNRNNEHISLAKLGEDSIFGEMAVISEKPRSATVMAVSDTWCYAINKDTFLQKLKGISPEVRHVFNELVEAIREKSNAAVIIDHGEIRPIEGLAMDGSFKIQKKPATITPSIQKNSLLQNQSFMTKVDEMDVFMRKLFKSLMSIAYQ